MGTFEGARSHAEIAFGVPIAMRDGTVLRADIFRPATDQPVPVLLVRNPYPPQAARGALDQFNTVEAGFAVVVQSARGTGASGTGFEPWRWEEVDGVDTIAWCAAQPWSNGSVGMWGGSYLGHVQLFAAGGAPQALKVMSPTIVPSAPYDLTYQGGALLLGSALGWVMMQAMLQMLPALMSGQDVGADFAEWQAASADQVALCRRAPLRDIAFLERWFPAWQQWLDHPRNDEWWQSVDINDRPAIPSFFVGGWWDIFLRGTIDEFNREPRHPRSRLVIGPWSHMNHFSAHGQVAYGPTAAAAMSGLDLQRLDYVGRYLVPGRAEPEGPPVRIFVMGRNQWRDEEAWPLARAVERRYYLHADATLSLAPPAAEAEPSTFLFDPLDPVPTLAGRNLLAGSDGGANTGPHDHRPHDHRGDILRFESDVLTDDLEVTGEIRVRLHAATSAFDTDWTAMLLDVWPDGRSYQVTEGIIRARHHAGNDHDDFIPARQPHLFEIDLIATSQVFLAGHRLRVDISSSNFPRYDRNPGTGALSSQVAEAEFVAAHQTVFHDAARASWISLPVIES